MRWTQLIALLLLVSLTVALLPALSIKEAQAAQTPVVGASRWPSLSAYHVPTYPYRNQPYTLWGWLSWWGTPLPNRYVQLWYKFPGQTTWHFLKSAHTDANGRYAFYSSSGARTVQWMVKYAGDSVYYSATKYDTVTVGWSRITFNIDIHTEANGNCFIWGDVRNKIGQPLKYVSVDIYKRSTIYPNNFVYVATVSTNAKGEYKLDPYTGSKYDTTKIVFRGYPLAGGNPYYWYSEYVYS